MHKQAHSGNWSITPIHCFKLVLCLSLFRKALPRRPVASTDTHTTMVTAQHGELPVEAVAERTTGRQCAEAPGGGTVQQDGLHLQEGHSSRGKDINQATSTSRKAKEEEEVQLATRKALPGNRASHRSHTILPP